MPTVKEELGWLPESIWHLTKGDYWQRFFKDSRDPLGINQKRSSLYEGHTEFNPLLAERVYRYWSNEDDEVLDPFAGRTTRGLVARVMGRHYEGYEVAPLTFEETKQNLTGIEKCWQPSMFNQQLGKWQLWMSDGTILANTLDKSKDFIFTCPPYWKLEQYEQALDQLSQINDYSAFIECIKRCALNCYRVLKSGRFCVWVVNDFRLDGRFYPFHSDVIWAFRPSGLILHDIIINRLNSPVVMGAAQARRLKQTLKIHEYLLVWKKM
jgi:DNA modification methylase